MFRRHAACWLLLSATIFTTGCGWFRDRNTCCGYSERSGLFSRFRPASSTRPIIVPTNGCCDAPVTGPYLPSAPQGSVLPAPQPSIPRIDENGKQLPWDPKMSKPGVKTGFDPRTKEGT